MKGIGKWLIIAFLVWWVIYQPEAAAHAVQGIGHLATKAATSLATVASSV